MIISRGWEEGEKESCSFIGVEFKFYKMKTFWKWTVVTVAQPYECT